MSNPLLLVPAAVGSLVTFIAAYVGIAALPLVAIHAVGEPVADRVVLGVLGALLSAGIAALALQGWAWSLRQLFQDPPKPPEVIPMIIQVGPKGTVF